MSRWKFKNKNIERDGLTSPNVAFLVDRFRNFILCLSFILTSLTTACSMLQGADPNEATLFSFAVTDLKANADGTYTLSWPAVPEEGVSYAIYSRKVSQAYDFSKAITSTQQTTWQTGNIMYDESTCFVVRYVKEGLDPDQNTAELCTKPTLLSFGLKTLNANGDGTWTLSWDKLDIKNVQYAIYSRRENDAYNFKSPVAQTTYTSYKTLDLTFEPDTCFIVRFGIVGAEAIDNNTSEKCLRRPAYSFPGLTGMTVNSDGSYLLSWEPVPTGNQVNYNIYSTTTPGEYDFSTQLDSVTTTSYKTPIYPIDANICFVVRFVTSTAADANSAELCSQTSPVSDFAGISAVTSPDTATARITWVPSANSSVAGYRVYSGTDFSKREAVVGPEVSSAVVANLPVGTTVRFGVRAFDKYGREDSNTKTMAVSIINLLPPSFSGLQSAVLSGTNSIVLSWIGAGGSPSAYHVYRGVVDVVDTQPTGASIATTVNWFNKIATVPATGNSGTVTYTLTNVGTDQVHYIGVRAANSSGIEDLNTVVIAVTVPYAGPPSFAGVTSVQNVGGKVKASWSAPIGATSSFVISWTDGTTTNSASISPKESGSYVTNYTTATVLAGNRTYTFDVHAVDRFGFSDSNTATQSITLGDTTPPDQLTSVVPAPLDENRVKITFPNSTSPGVVDYIIRICTGLPAACTSSSQFTLANATKATVGGNTEMTVTGLSKLTNYTFNVTAINGNNIESTPAQVTVMTPKTTPPVFSGITALNYDPNDNTKLRVSWSAGSSDTVKYYVFIGTVQTPTLPATPQTNLNTLTAASIAGALPANVQRIIISPQTAEPLSWGTPTTSLGTVSKTGSNFELDIPDLGSAMGYTYYARVYAADSANPVNVAVSSVELSKSIPVVTLPTAPTYTAVWSASDGGVKITWNNITDAGQYTIYRANFGSSFPADSSPTYTVSAGVLQYIDVMPPGTNDGSSFIYRVKSKAGAIFSANADSQGPVNIPIRTPPTFAGITSAAFSGMTTLVNLSWPTATSALATVQSYKVYIKGQPGVTNISAGASLLVKTVSAPATSVTLGLTMSDASPSFNLEHGQKYNFRVEALDNFGNETSTPWSSDVTWGVDSTPSTLTINPIPANTVLKLADTYTLVWTVNKPGTLFVTCNNTTIKTQAVTQTDIDNITFPTVSISGSDLNTVSAMNGPKTIRYSFVDSGGIANGNTVLDATLILSLVPSSSVTNLKLYKLGEGSNNPAIQLSWTNPSFNSGDTLTIVKKTGATVPTSVTDGTAIVTNIPTTNTNYSVTNLGTAGNTSYAVFVCNVYGTCSTDVSSNGAVYQMNVASMQNLSAGGAATFTWSGTGTTPYYRLAVSKNKKALYAWDGVTSNATVTVLTSTGAETSYSCGNDATPFPGAACMSGTSSAQPWELRYFRVSVTSAASGTNSFAMSDIRTWARVPEGMVFVGKDDWNAKQYGNMRHTAFDFAIDRYEVYETTTATNAGGNGGSAAYPNTYNSVLKSAAGQTPKRNLDWYRFKQGCFNRTLEPEVSSWVIGTATSFHPRRQIHLATDMEWFIGSSDTPDVGGAANCNIDNRANPFNTGTTDTQNCVSRFGTFDMVGNLWEWTDAYYANGTGAGDAQTRTTYFGSSSSLNETTLKFPSGSAYVTSYDWSLGLPSATSGSASSTFASDYFLLGTGTTATLRGGDWSQSTSAGRFSAAVSYAPGTSDNAYGGRCAITAPAPRITRFQNDSIGSKAQFYWNVANPDSEGSVIVKLAFSSNKAELDAWNGEDSTTFTNGAIITFAQSGVNQTSPTSNFPGFTGCGTYTPVVGTGVTYTGSCSLDLAAAPFNLTRGSKRFFRLYASNTTISGGGPGTGAISTTKGVGYAPPGMVYVAKEDWPADILNEASSGTTFDGNTGAFDFAIDKYTAHVASIGSGDAGSAAYPNTFDTILRSSYNQLPATGFDWFRMKQGCDNRNLESDYSGFVAGTVDEIGPKKRVHLTTDIEYLVGSYQTLDEGGAGNCNIDYHAGSPANTGTAATANCISRYGALDMIGNVWHFVDSYWTGISGSSGTRTTYYGTGVSNLINTSFSNLPTTDFVTAFDFLTGIPTAVDSAASSIFSSDKFFAPGGATAVVIRGGSFGDYLSGGRYTVNMSVTSTTTNSNLGGRCAIVFP